MIKDYYWTTTKQEYINRLKILNDTWKMSVWNHLQAYIIRGKTEIPLWRACYNLFKASGLLAANISVNSMSKHLNISTGKIKMVLNDLDNNDYIIKYSSKNGKSHNTNIYILGIINTNMNDDTSIHREELYFLDKINAMSNVDRNKIIELFDIQLQTAKIIRNSTEELFQIQTRLFAAIGHEKAKKSRS